MLLSFKQNILSVILRVKLLDKSQTDGRGLTGLLFSSTGLIISTIVDNEAAATVYSQSAGTIETVNTFGTFSGPTATKCRFKELDATNHKGVYEIQFANTRYGVAGARNLLVSISGATNLMETDFIVQLYDSFENADILLGRDLGSNVNQGVNQERTVRSALRFLRNKWAIAAGVMTVYAENDTTAMWTSALTSNAAADPVTTSDPT